jgi:pimeloyl-ACP methyl ester carboxylesterase
VERLRRVLPNAEVAELAGLGHMAPVTDPEAVNPVICRFLEKVDHD